MGPAGPQGERGPQGLQGVQGERGVSGIRVVWKDAAGVTADRVIAGLAGRPGEERAYYVDNAVRFWGINLKTAALSAGAEPVATLFWDTVNCSGTAYVVEAGPLPRFTFKTASVIPPFDTDYFVHADNGGIIASLTPRSLDNNGADACP
jgi:hypothetical protein